MDKVWTKSNSYVVSHVAEVTGQDFWPHGVEPALYARLLMFSNAIRAVLGHPHLAKLLPGIKGIGKACVLANSVNCGLSVGPNAAGDGIVLFSDNQQEIVKLAYHEVGTLKPDSNGSVMLNVEDASFFRFICDFDNGAYPELIGELTEEKLADAIVSYGNSSDEDDPTF